ncbi:glycoside hydrolase family 3 N-terminal domain-containing protein, partial [uncultured Muribaculum sp.]
MKRVLIIMSLLVATAFHVGAVQPKLLSHSKGGDRDAWVDSVFSSLTMEQRVGQLVVPVVDPTHIATAKQVIYRYVKTEGVGGLLFSKGSIDQYATLIDYAQSIAKVPLMITLDGEWGLSMRIPGTTRFPYNMGLGAIADENLLYDYGREVARQCKLMGITVNFAPVLDVNSNPDNPVIGYRSFGEDADRVARLGIAYSRGLEDGGVMSVSKHFPGHGDTSVDSHKSMPTID